MSVVASVFVGLAALLHVFIFVLESLRWRQPATWQRFGVANQQDADTTASMAYNQGFYNLFLGLGAALGLVLFATGHETAGRTLVLFSTASMWLAATVLITTGLSYLRPALTQGTLPFIGFVLFLFV